MSEQAPSSKRRRYFAGSTLQQALGLAASHFRVAVDRIAYRVVEKRHGFVKVPRRLVIEVDPDHPERPAGVPAPAPPRPVAPPRPAPLPAPARPRSDRPGPERRFADRGERGLERERVEVERMPLSSPVESPAEVGDVEALARAALGRLVKLAGLDLTSTVRWAGGELAVDLSGPDRTRLLADEAELLQAIEYLLPRSLHGTLPEGAPCRVDSAGYRQEREEALRQLAFQAAEEVRATGRAVTLDTMNPAERRIVHMTIKEDPELTTESEGEGFFKRVVVMRR